MEHRGGREIVHCACAVCARPPLSAVRVRVGRGEREGKGRVRSKDGGNWEGGRLRRNNGSGVN